MKFKMCFIPVLLLPLLLSAQYEQKMSIALSAGTFKTFGWKFGDVEPMQMPNYGIGLAVDGGLQFLINDRLALLAEFGIKVSQSWYYDIGDGTNYMYWSIRDTTNNKLIADGENYLDLFNYNLSLKPKYYLGQGGKWNPYVFAGITINLTKAYFEDQGWKERDNQGLLPPDDPGPLPTGFLEKNIGIGFNPGVGLEYNLNDQWYFFLQSGYYFIALSKDNFKIASREEFFHSFLLQLGTRIYFIKTKDL